MFDWQPGGRFISPLALTSTVVLKSQVVTVTDILGLYITMGCVMPLLHTAVFKDFRNQPCSVLKVFLTEKKPTKNHNHRKALQPWMRGIIIYFEVLIFLKVK